MKNRVPKTIITLMLFPIFLKVAGAQTPAERLLSGALEGEYEIVKQALDKGAAPNTRDEDGMTALMWAAGAGASDVVDLMIEVGADVNLKDNQGWTALRHAFEFEGAFPDPDIPEFHQAFVGCLNSLIAAGADTSVKDDQGMSLVELAGTEEIRALLQKAVPKG